jgi:hypothetical protein
VSNVADLTRRLAAQAGSDRRADRDTPALRDLDPDQALAEATSALGGLAGDPIVLIQRAGTGLDQPMTATTSSGAQIRWGRQEELTQRRTLASRVIAAGFPPPPKNLDIERAFALLVRAAQITSDYDDRDEAREWLAGFTAASEDREADLTDRASRYAAALDLARHRPYDEPPLLIIDAGSGTHYATRGAIAAFTRRDLRVTISLAALTGRLAEIGAEAHDLQQWQPDVPRAEAHRAFARTYRWKP